jgi:UDP-3-O-[3-hydroxymyristoyl] N-acetylglucosamine deacetylase
MTPRPQRTLARSTETCGRGLFSGRPVQVEFLPAAAGTGIAFQRLDLPGAPVVPANIAYVVAEPRRTVLAKNSVRIELVEHVLAALAGLSIDNCLIRLDAPELPNGDGSAEKFVAALLDGGIIEQPHARRVCRITDYTTIRLPGRAGSIELAPALCDELTITAAVNYPAAAIGCQTFATVVEPNRFVTDISFARTFVLESEVAAFRAQGIGLATSFQDLLVFGAEGPIDNDLHTLDECARHKVLDCIGDFALLGADIIGSIRAVQSGHALNHEVVRTIERLYLEPARRQAAA